MKEHAKKTLKGKKKTANLPRETQLEEVRGGGN